MARWGMVIDLDRCNRLQACEVACRSENNVAVGGPQAARESRTISWMRVQTELRGEWPDVRAPLRAATVHAVRPTPVHARLPGAGDLHRPRGHRQPDLRAVASAAATGANACPYTVK